MPCEPKTLAQIALGVSVVGFTVHHGLEHITGLRGFGNTGVTLETGIFFIDDTQGRQRKKLACLDHSEKRTIDTFANPLAGSLC